jgi:hypothetical protein
MLLKNNGPLLLNAKYLNELSPVQNGMADSPKYKALLLDLNYKFTILRAIIWAI